MKNWFKFKNLKNSDKFNLFLVDLCVFLSMISMFFFGASTVGVKKDASFEYLAETALHQEKHHLIHGQYNSGVELSVAEYNALQRNAYESFFYRRINSYYVAGADNNLIDFSLQFDDEPSEVFHTKAVSVSTYTNYKKMMETIKLELYKIIDYDYYTKDGYDGMCYLPSSIADTIIESNLTDDIETYDDIINRQMSFTITGGPVSSQYSGRWTVNNIFYTGAGQHDGPTAEGYLGKDEGYGTSLLSILGSFIVTTNIPVHQISGSTLFFDFYNSLFIAKDYIDFAYGPQYASDGSTIEFYTYAGSTDTWVKIDNLPFFNSLYIANYSYFYSDNIFSLICTVIFLSMALYPLYRLSDLEGEGKAVKDLSKKAPFIKEIAVFLIPFLAIHLIYSLFINFLPISIDKVLAYNIVGTVSSIIITCHILNMYLLPLLLKKRNEMKKHEKIH